MLFKWLDTTIYWRKKELSNPWLFISPRLIHSTVNSSFIMLILPRHTNWTLGPALLWLKYRTPFSILQHGNDHTITSTPILLINIDMPILCIWTACLLFQPMCHRQVLCPRTPVCIALTINWAIRPRFDYFRPPTSPAWRIAWLPFKASSARFDIKPWVLIWHLYYWLNPFLNNYRILLISLLINIFCT